MKSEVGRILSPSVTPSQNEKQQLSLAIVRREDANQQLEQLGVQARKLLH